MCVTSSENYRPTTLPYQVLTRAILQGNRRLRDDKIEHVVTYMDT